MTAASANPPIEQVLQARINVLRAYVQMLQEAHDAQKVHNIDYHDLREYGDTDVLDEANKLPIIEAQSLLITWIETIRNAIVAAIRRKSFKRIK